MLYQIIVKKVCSKCELSNISAIYANEIKKTEYFTCDYICYNIVASERILGKRTL